MLAGAGVPILRALQAAAETLHNTAMRADAEDALALTWDAGKAGVAAAFVATPFYYPLPQAALLDHYRYLARRGRLPLIPVSDPAAIGNVLDPATLAELATVEGIAGVALAVGVVAVALVVQRVMLPWRGGRREVDELLPLQPVVGINGAVAVGVGQALPGAAGVVDVGGEDDTVAGAVALLDGQHAPQGVVGVSGDAVGPVRTGGREGAGAGRQVARRRGRWDRAE